jgi:hypothetical protein
MTRDDLERRVWEIAGRQLTGSQVDDIVAAAEAFAVVRREEKQEARNHMALRHEHATDLYPVIAALAEALMPEVPHVAARGAAQRRETSAVA